MKAAGILLIALALFSAACANQPAQTPTHFCILSVQETGDLALMSGQGERLATIHIGERPHEIEMSPDGAFAYVTQFGITDYDSRIGTPGDRVLRVDANRRRITGAYILPGQLRAPHGVKLRPPLARELFVNAEAGGDTMLVYDVESGRLLRQFPLPRATHNFVFSPDGSALFSFAGAEGVSKIDPDSGHVLATLRLETPVRGLFIARDGGVLAGARGEIVVLRAGDLAVQSRVPVPVQGQLVYLAELSNGAIVAPSLNDNGVVLVSPDRTRAHFITTGATPIVARQGPDGLIYVSNVDDRHISVLNEAGEEVSQIGGLTNPNGLGFGHC